MVIETLPTAEAIRIESRLNPEQVAQNMTEDGLRADIEARITAYRPVVEKSLVAVEDTPDNQKIATRALLLRVLASLYGTAGKLTPGFWERRNGYKAESDELIAGLLNGETDDSIDGIGTGAGTLSTAPYRLSCDDELVVNG